MNASANTLIVVLSDAENTAKRVENHLRNAGHPVRTRWTSDLSNLKDLLTGSSPDLLLCTEGLPHAPFEQVMQQCLALNKDLPVLLLTDHYTAENTLMALDMGARDQVSYEDARHLRHLERVCLRELDAYENFRKLQQTRAETAEVESRNKHLLTESTDAVASVSEGIIVEMNPAFVQLLKHKNADDLVGLPLMDLLTPESQPRIKDYLKLLHKGKAEAKPVECGLLKADRGFATVKASFSLSRTSGETLVQLLIKSPKSAPAPEVVATGRIPFMKLLATALRQPQQQPQAAVLVSVDDFSAIETRLGFADSDEAILKLMEWLRARLGPREQLLRVSSGELALLVGRPQVSDIVQLCEMFCREIHKQVFATRNNEAHLSVSIAAYPFATDEKPDHVIAEITREARQLSASGGNRFVMLGPTAKSAEAAREEARQAALIKKAIEDNRLRLAYQSISSLEGDPRQHTDILLRIINEQGKEIPAADFISIAEKFNLTRVLDRWVTSSALKIIAKRKPADEPTTLFVRISEETLKEAETFVAWLAETLKDRALQPGDLVFTFQEVRLQNHIRKAKTLTKALQDLGVGVAIDHFGKGSNSMQLMDHIPANFIKFDASFTRDFNDKDIFKTMSDIMEAAKKKQMKIIVCHVEDANVMARLWQMGVNYIQGFHVQEPILSAADISPHVSV